MWICYVDEAGCTGVLPHAVSDIQPIFVIAGIMVDQTRLRNLTLDFLRLKIRFYPGARLSTGFPPANLMEWVLVEIKGAEVRRDVCAPGRRTWGPALVFLDNFVQLLTDYNVRIVGRLFVKGIGLPFSGTAVYASSIQSICRVFHNFLGSVHDEGFIIADSRNKEQNANVSYSIFTQKFKVSGDDYSSVLEMPTFGHSENHAGIQIADLLCSALLFPMGVDAYCAGRLTGCHIRPHYRVLRTRFGSGIRRLQHRFQEPGTGNWHGGIWVTGAAPGQDGGLLFRVP